MHMPSYTHTHTHRATWKEIDIHPYCRWNMKHFPGGSHGKESACNGGDPGSIPGLGRSPREGNGNPLQYSCLENSIDREDWWAKSMDSQRVSHNWTTNTHTHRSNTASTNCIFVAAIHCSVQFSSVQLLSLVRLFATPWTKAGQASLSITNSRSLLKLMSIESVMPSNHLILCHSLLLPPSIFPSIRVFSNEPVLPIRWPKNWISAWASILPMNIEDWFPLGWTGWIYL